MTRVQQVGDQIEELLAGLTASGQGTAAEELVRLLVGLYGDGLARIAGTLSDEGAAGAAMLGRLAEDPLVESLFLLHGLHPLDVDTRIQRALDRVRPYLGSHAGGVQYVGVTDGVALLRLEGNCDGCPSSTVTVKLAIEGAVQDAAPEVSEIVVEGVTEPPAPPGPVLLQIGSRPEADAAPGARQHNRRGHGDPPLLGPRDAVRLPRGVRGLRRRPGLRAAGPGGADLRVRRDL
jgi:Fe-S cluster biogenesis protein NfuA